ncbi:MAG: VCBS repeat-containing protein [Acidobacteria bacterium]|nr:VCBS repeat-containing protein [Acidobacteriota bacterium]
MPADERVPPEDPPGEPIPEAELVPADDTVIGRAFRRSLILIGFAGILAAAGWWLAGRTEPGPAPVEPEIVPPRPRAPTAHPPAVRFTDITAASGIDFVHANGAVGEKLLPETMGGGVAFLDYDGDGDPDLLFVNSDFWPGRAPAGRPRPTMRLYRNDGAGRFEDATGEAGLAVSFYGMGVAAGDTDGDGDPDLFFSAVGPNRMFRNDRGRFREVTAEAGVAGDPGEWSTAAGFFDYDNDGDLDLFVGNYVRWSREIDFAVDYRLTGIGRAYGPPTNFQGTQPYLYRNQGDGTFRDVSAEAGIRVTNPATGVPVAKALGLGLADIGRDGWIDVLVANDTVRNFLYRNRGDGGFEEVGFPAGVAYDNDGNATGAMGVDAAEFRNDGRLAFAIGNFANEMSSLYLAQGDPWRFTDEAIAEGVGGPSRLRLKFGVLFLDYDLDGRLDLLQANGHIEEEINQVQPSQEYRQPAQLFWNAGPDPPAAFVEVPGEVLGDLSIPIVGRGAAYADIDADGDLDLILTQVAGPPLLLRNDQRLGHHWLRFRLRGRGGNRDAIGAWVELTSGGVTQRRQVMPTRSYLSQVELPVTFGLGQEAAVESVRVLWPDGTVQEVEVPGVDRLIEVSPEESELTDPP